MRALGGTAVLLLALACERAPAGGEAAPAISSHAPAEQPPAAASIPEAAAPSPPSFADLFLGDPAPSTRRSETVWGSAVYAGLPPGWSTQDVYNNYLLAQTKQARAMVYLISDKSPIAEMPGRSDDSALDAFVKSAAHAVFLRAIDWETAWLDAEIGPNRYAGRVRRGSGKSVVQKDTRRAAWALYVPVPDRTPIRILGSWNDPDPEVEQQFIELVRGIGRCRHKPKRGCVPVAPRGEEQELENPPKAAPGSSPFG
jgi:hypothetical protein